MEGKSHSMMFWKKDKKYKGDPNDVKLEPDEYNEKDVGIFSLFGPFVKNYASSLAKTRSPAKLPYPPQFYHPQSSLQHQCDLQMTHFDVLIDASLQPHPLNRFLGMLQYYISTCRVLKFPYKPIIAMMGETAQYYTRYRGSTNPQDSPTYFIGEQLVKEPPACSFYAHNPTYGVTYEGGVTLNPKFKQAHVRVAFEGAHKTTFVNPQGLFREEYYSQLPDLIIRLLRMHTELVGDVSVTCPTNGYAANLSFKEKAMFSKVKNLVSGKITHNGVDLYTIEGVWDEAVYLIDVTTGLRTELTNRATLPKNVIESPPLSALPETSGEKIWGQLIGCLLRQDWNAATIVKTQINEQENARFSEYTNRGIIFQPQFFRLDERGEWKIKDPTLRFIGTPIN